MNHAKSSLLASIFFILALGITGCEDMQGDPDAIAQSETELAQIKWEQQVADRRLLEEKRQQELGEFYVPLPALETEFDNPPVEARGVYVTGSVAGFSLEESKIEKYISYVKQVNGIEEIQEVIDISDVNKLERAIALCAATEMNALVIDVKSDDGRVTYASKLPIVEQVGANTVISIKDVERLMKVLKKYDVYPIARIVAFKDSNFAKKMPDHAIKLKDGEVWHDNKGIAWVNPFDKYVWDYNVALAKEAALKGFREIQFDYVRFPDNAKSYNPITEFPGRNDRKKDDAIEDFLKYAQEQLSDYQVYLGADVFGVATRSWDDKPEDIGQTWRKISRQVDYICPMVYPSHYGPQWYGYEVPDANPYGVLRGAALEAIKRNSSQEKAAVIRPWIQGFTASWVNGYISYTPEVINRQLVALRELGIDEYLIWNPSVNYAPQIFKYQFTPESTKDDFLDFLGRSPREVLNDYLKAVQRDKYPTMYLLSSYLFRDVSYDQFVLDTQAKGWKLLDYQIGNVQEKEEGVWAEVTYSYRTGTEEILVEQERWYMCQEHQLWKVQPWGETMPKTGSEYTVLENLEEISSSMAIQIKEDDFLSKILSEAKFYHVFLPVETELADDFVWASDLVKKHVLVGNYDFSEEMKTKKYKTAGGKKIKLEVNENSLILINENILVQEIIPCSNGKIYWIDSPIK